MAGVKDTSAVVLAGGLGTRLRLLVPNVPKPMAEIAGRPFLDYIVRRLLDQGVVQIVLCVSYLREQIIEYFSARYPDSVSCSIEERPLGTAGAVRNALTQVRGNRFMILNGDSFVPINYGELLSFHESSGAALTMTLVDGRGSQFGRVKIDKTTVVDFREKGDGGAGYVNAGVYVVERDILSAIPAGVPCSIEYQFLPNLLEKRVRVAAFVASCELIDIGLPERYKFLRQNPQLLEQ